MSGRGRRARTRTPRPAGRTAQCWSPPESPGRARRHPCRPARPPRSARTPGRCAGAPPARPRAPRRSRPPWQTGSGYLAERRARIAPAGRRRGPLTDPAPGRSWKQGRRALPPHCRSAAATGRGAARRVRNTAGARPDSTTRTLRTAPTPARLSHVAVQAEDRAVQARPLVGHLVVVQLVRRRQRNARGLRARPRGLWPAPYSKGPTSARRAADRCLAGASLEDHGGWARIRGARPLGCSGGCRGGCSSTGGHCSGSGGVWGGAAGARAPAAGAAGTPPSRMWTQTPAPCAAGRRARPPPAPPPAPPAAAGRAPARRRARVCALARLCSRTGRVVWRSAAARCCARLRAG